MKIAVCGGRKYGNFKLIRATLSELKPKPTMVIVGEGAVDEYAASWAAWFGIPFKQFKADWNNFGVSADVIRMQQMIGESPDVVVAFPGDATSKDFVERARKAGARVMEVEDKPVETSK